MASSTLDTIRQKVRRITRSPSVNLLSNADLDQYINTAIECDIPTTMKLFSLRTVLTFYTQPGIDVYETNTVNVDDPLYNFKNKYTAVHPTVYIAGVASFYTQERAVFYGNWPQTNFVGATGLFGNGTTGPFTGFIQTHPMLQNNVVLSALDASGAAMILVDYPIIDLTTGLPNPVVGALGLPGQPQVLPSPYGQVNYITGAFSAIFPNATANSGTNNINSEVIGYVAGIPTTMLYYDNKFTLRPVPDKAYVVQIEADIRPTELLSSTDVPQISQWWQWIAYLASKKIFQDRMDTDSVQMIMPELMEQQSLVLSTAMEQYTNQRSITIYTNNGISNGWNNFGRWPY